jgi:spore germination protein GerM
LNSYAENNGANEKRIMRRISPIIGMLSVSIIVGSLILLSSRESASQNSTRSQPLTKAAVNLYFSDKDNFYLMAETRTLPHPAEPNDFGKVIVQALEKGPTGGLTRTIPQGTRVRAFYLAEGGAAVVDLSESVSENHPGGCKTEMLTIYSLVNSLILNIPEIGSVKILIGGREAMTLAGHVELRFPFKANMLLIR